MTAPEPWKELRRIRIFEHYGRAVDRVTFKLPSGLIDDFYIKSEGATVCTLALTNQREVVLARQFRPGPAAILDELPGGWIDLGETPLEAARRELIEETGYSGNFLSAGSLISDAYTKSVMHCFVATECHQVTLPQSTPLEPIEVSLMSLVNFRAHLKSGQITDMAAGYLALDHLGLL
jgi:ADP-ribose pyrophosphatase